MPVVGRLSAGLSAGCRLVCRLVCRPGRDGGRSAPNRPRRWPLCRHFVGVSGRRIDHRTGIHVDSARSATATPTAAASRCCISGASATVAAAGQTVATLPPRHADTMSADRPPSAAIRGGSTTVTARPGQIDHRHGPTRADRPPSQNDQKTASTSRPGRSGRSQ